MGEVQDLFGLRRQQAASASVVVRCFLLEPDPCILSKSPPPRDDFLEQARALNGTVDLDGDGGWGMAGWDLESEAGHTHPSLPLPPCPYLDHQSHPPTRHTRPTPSHAGRPEPSVCLMLRNTGIAWITWFSILASLTQHPGEQPGFLFDAPTMKPLVGQGGGRGSWGAWWGRWGMGEVGGGAG